MNWEKLCPNLIFTVKNKIEKLHKVWHISDVSSNFNNLSMNWDKLVFHMEQMEF